MKRNTKLFIALLVAFSMTACSKAKPATVTAENNKNKPEVTTTTNNDSNTSTSTTDQSTSTPSTTGSDTASDSTPKSTTPAQNSNTSSTQNSTTNNTPAKPNNTASTAPAATPTPAPAATPAPPAKPPTVTVTIPEGFSISEIGNNLAASGVCTKADFLNAINTYNFNNYQLVAQIPSNPNRTFKLEGYLFPNTYQFNLNKPAQDAVGVMIRGAENKITSQYSYPGMSLDQIVTLASIIQKESPNSAEMVNISSVFHNRLDQKYRLQADSTIFYIERNVKPIITGDVNRYNNYYNTYKCPALPAGPICNPGTAALNAAVHPAQTKYLYFVSDKTGKTYYSETYDQQKANCALAGVTPGSANTPSGQ